MRTKHPQQQAPTSLAQCLGAAQADAERMYCKGSAPAWRPTAFDWRPLATAGVAVSALAACAVALLWPWEAPPVAAVEPAALTTAATAAPRSAAVAVDGSSSTAAGVQIDAPIASPFGAPVAALPDGSLDRPVAPSAAWSGAELPISTEATARGCSADCPPAAVPAPAMPVLAPGATILAALPVNLEAWALDPQPLAAPAAATASLQRPLGNTPEIPNDNDPTPAEEAAAESTEVPAQLPAE